MLAVSANSDNIFVATTFLIVSEQKNVSARKYFECRMKKLSTSENIFDVNFFLNVNQRIENCPTFFLPSANIFFECRMKIFCQQTKNKMSMPMKKS